MPIKRRTFLQGTAALGFTAIGAPAIAQSKTKLKVGYLHTPAVDGQIWTGLSMGSFDRNGVDLEMVRPRPVSAVSGHDRRQPRHAGDGA